MGMGNTRHDIIMMLEELLGMGNASALHCFTHITWIFIDMLRALRSPG
jgi:hypothetical protein